MPQAGRVLPAKPRCQVAVLALAALTGPLSGLLIAQDGGAASARGSTTPPAPTDDGPRGLIAITRCEAERERQRATEEVVKLINELGASSDTGLTYVTRRLERLARIGPATLPLLFQTLEKPASTESEKNRGYGSARALALITKRGHASRVIPRLIELAGSPSPLTRILAARALGWSGRQEGLAPLEKLLGEKDAHVVEAAARALGDLGRPEAASVLAPLLSREDDGIRAAAIEALAALDMAGFEDTFASLLEHPPKDKTVLAGILKYLGHHGDADCVASIGHIVTDRDQPAQTRRTAAHTLRDIALDKGARARLKVLDILAPLLVDARLTSFITEIAHILDDLGDERGLEKIVSPESAILKQNPRHFYSRYARAKKYYQFGRYAEAIADSREALRWGRKEKGAGELRLLMAACHAGLGNFKTARRVLHDAGLKDLRDLPKTYPEFKAMAEDKRYASLFGK